MISKLLEQFSGFGFMLGRKRNMNKKPPRDLQGVLVVDDECADVVPLERAEIDEAQGQDIGNRHYVMIEGEEDFTVVPCLPPQPEIDNSIG
jgi:hypothetical protein